jgi:hypothetical protein
LPDILAHEAGTSLQKFNQSLPDLRREVPCGRHPCQEALGGLLREPQQALLERPDGLVREVWPELGEVPVQPSISDPVDVADGLRDGPSAGEAVGVIHGDDPELALRRLPAHRTAS